MEINCEIGDFKFLIQFPQDWQILQENLLAFKSPSIINIKRTITVNFSIYNKTLQLGDPIFVGDNSNESFLQHIWSVHRIENDIYYNIKYLDHPHFDKILFTCNNHEVQVFVAPHLGISPISINPFIHPFGVLMLSRLQQIHGGLLIHASGINDNGKGYLFTGVSGIGKSTMAQIWKSIGAEIVNDDRLMICEDGKEFSFYNTPMPHYNDFYKSAPLKGIFLLSQSKTNSCTQISGIKALTLVMANFLQQFFDSEIVAQHLNKTETLINSVPVYQLGFKPDADVVNLVRSLNL